MNPVQDADPQSHEGFGEIDHLLSLRRDGEAGHRQVRFLLRDTNRQSGLATRTNITVGTTSDAGVLSMVRYREEEEDQGLNEQMRQRFRKWRRRREEVRRFQIDRWSVRKTSEKERNEINIKERRRSSAQV